jgi:hypothetical protein
LILLGTEVDAPQVGHTPLARCQLDGSILDHRLHAGLTRHSGRGSRGQVADLEHADLVVGTLDPPTDSGNLGAEGVGVGSQPALPFLS